MSALYETLSKRCVDVVSENTVKSKEDANRLMAEMCKELAAISVIEAEMNATIAEATKRAESKALAIVSSLLKEEAAIITWADQNWDSEADGKRTIKLPAGKIELRKSKEKVIFNKKDEPAIIEAIKHLAEMDSDYLTFIRTYEEIRKEDLKADKARAAKIPGIVISSEGDTLAVVVTYVEVADV